MKSVFGILFPALIVIGICFLLYCITTATQRALARKSQKKHLKEENLEKQAKKLLYDFETIRIRMILEKMNFDYALGLYDGEIDFISETQNPLAKLPDYVDNESPTLEKFQTELFSRVDHFLKSSPLSQEEQEYIREEAYWQIEHTDQDELAEVIESYKEGIPKEFYFLKGKIDFTAASLSLLMSIAKDEENMKLQNHLLKIQKKRDSL